MSSFTNTLFSTTVQFHKGDMVLTCDDLGLPQESQFGIITHTVATGAMDPTETLLVIDIDNSGSMECNDKMELVKHTVKNILRTIVDKKMPIHVHILTFNSEIKNVVDLTAVTSDNLEDLLKKVDAIYADGFTNIELALNESRGIGMEFKKRHHLFLTDGLPTDGETDTDNLAKLLDENFPGTYIGYGEEHNHEVLTAFAKKNSESSYQLVNNVEMIGNLCGEVLYNICYPVATNIQISTPFEKDLIYDATSNTWTNNIYVDTFTSGKTYRYPIYTTEECAMLVHTRAYSVVTGEQVFTEVFMNPTDERFDLTKEMFRHATNHLLSMPNIDKQKVRAMFRKVRAYAREHDLLQDTYYKLIFDDLYTCFHGDQMHISARVTSNTRNQTFRSASGRAPIRRQNANSGGLQRSISASYNDFELDDNMGANEDETVIEVYEYGDEDNIENFVSEDTQNMCDATQDMAEIMRAVSS
jgi:uncharacterized protein YegL